MKTIGSTNTGQRLVEMSEDEHRVMVRLQEVVAGGTREDLNFAWTSDSHRLDADLSSVMGVIAAWAMIRFRINEMERTFASFREQLEKMS